MCERTVATALQRLKALGILAWVRRCAARVLDDGRHVLEQETNAYAVHQDGWRGYRPPPDPPAPVPSTWDVPPTMATPTGDVGATAIFLAAEADNPLAAALARLGRAIAAKPL